MEQLWTDKHKPRRLEGISGQNKAVAQARAWLQSWTKGSALLISGPPGSGKTLLAESLALEGGLLLMQMNASDSRTVKEIESFLKEASVTRPIFHKGKLLLLDEVDGISGRERGAASAIAGIIRDSDFPVVMTANYMQAPKLKPLKENATKLKLTKVPTPSIAKRLREICEKEGIGAGPDVLKSLARWSQGDMRSAISDLQMVSHGKSEIGADDLEPLGFRERGTDIYSILPGIFHSGSLSASRRSIISIDKDPDEVFLWLDTNIPLEFRDPESRSEAFETMAKANLFRALVSKQQNWKFRGYMTDLMSGLSLFRREEGRGFVPYQYPRRIAELARSRARRARMDALATSLGEMLHSSKKQVKREFLPYFRLMVRARGPEYLGLTREEAELIS